MVSGHVVEPFTADDGGVVRRLVGIVDNEVLLKLLDGCGESICATEFCLAFDDIAEPFDVAVGGVLKICDDVCDFDVGCADFCRANRL